MKKAFTLIELLVVIAIIAILAAILFPVFAQAKAAAKASVLLSNTKQLGTGIVIYTTDNDDTFPLANVMRPTPSTHFGTGVAVPFPYNDDPYPQATWATAGRLNMAASQWGNACLPYIKTDGIYQNPVATNYLLNSNDGNPSWAVSPFKDNLAFNGLLHHYSATSVTAPSSAVLAWPAGGSLQLTGRVSGGDPALNCGNSIDDCNFNPGGHASAVPATSGGTPLSPASYSESIFFINPNESMWNFGTHRMPYVHTDSSAKASPTGSALAPSYVNQAGAFTDPFANVVSSPSLGFPGGTWDCSDGSTVYTGSNYADTYWCFFRPDRTK